jgi:hypothetical protein
MTTEVRELDLLFGLSRPVNSRTRRAARESGSHLVAILPRGEAIRNFVYSGTLEEVSRKVELSVLSVLPGKEFEDLRRAKAI